MLICSILWIIAIVLIVRIVLYSYQISDSDILVFAVVTLIIFVMITSLISKIFENKLKESVMPIVMKAFGDFVWTTASVIDKYTLRETRLFGRFEDKNDDDSFYGTYHGLHININETRLTSRDAERRKHTSARI